MLKKVLKPRGKGKREKKENTVLSMELAEIKEVADIIFKRLEKKIEVLEAIEASVDEKIATLERIVQQAESISTTSEKRDRRHEVIAMNSRGLKIDEIAAILDMPLGEVNLILNLHAEKR
jgi:DNA-directed RNA polymerase specialized sigma24 family protein